MGGCAIMKKSYRIDEAAQEFAVSRRTIYRLIERGELESFKVGDTRRIDADEIERIKKNAAEDENRVRRA